MGNALWAKISRYRPKQRGKNQTASSMTKVTIPGFFVSPLLL